MPITEGKQTVFLAKHDFAFFIFTAVDARSARILKVAAASCQSTILLKFRGHVYVRIVGLSIRHKVAAAAVVAFL